jgi:aspartyl protease family protein
VPVDPDDFARLAYLGLLLAFLAGAVFLRRGAGIGKSVRHLALWVLIFALVVIAYDARDSLRGALFPAQATLGPDGAIELRRGLDGHFHATLTVNGTPLRLLVDTGATDIVLSRADAERVGIDVQALRFAGEARTANGVVATAAVRLDRVEFGSVTDRDVAASVNAGDLDASLLGMAYLDRFESVEIVGDRMRLRR